MISRDTFKGNEGILSFRSELKSSARSDHKDIDKAIANGVVWKRHLGLYAYRLSALRRFTACNPTPLESTERLEQLRIMEQGGRIAMARASEFIPAGIDTQDDLRRVRALLNDIYNE